MGTLSHNILVCHLCGHLCEEELAHIRDDEPYAVAYTCVQCGLRYPIKTGGQYALQSAEASEVALKHGATRLEETFSCPHCTEKGNLQYSHKLLQQKAWWVRLSLNGKLTYWFQCWRCGFSTPQFPEWKQVLAFCQKVKLAVTEEGKKDA
jgi:hypothetical protein